MTRQITGGNPIQPKPGHFSFHSLGSSVVTRQFVSVFPCWRFQRAVQVARPPSSGHRVQAHSVAARSRRSSSDHQVQAQLLRLVQQREDPVETTRSRRSSSEHQVQAQLLRPVQQREDPVETTRSRRSSSEQFSSGKTALRTLRAVERSKVERKGSPPTATWSSCGLGWCRPG